MYDMNEEFGPVVEISLLMLKGLFDLLMVFIVTGIILFPLGIWKAIELIYWFLDK